MVEVFKRKLAIDPPTKPFELLVDITAHDVAEAVHGLTTGEYLAKTTRPDQLVPRVGLISEVEVTADTTEVDFPGLDILTHKLYLLAFETKNVTATSGEIRIYFEGDFTDTNYYQQNLWASGSTISAGRANNSTLAYLAAGHQVSGFILIMLDPDGYGRVYVAEARSPPAGVNIVTHSIARTITQTNLTRITLRATVANLIGAGSKFRLFAGEAV